MFSVYELFLKPKLFSVAYLSMNLMNLSQSFPLLIVYFASMLAGFPFTNFALTSTDCKERASSAVNASGYDLERHNNDGSAYRRLFAPIM